MIGFVTQIAESEFKSNSNWDSDSLTVDFDDSSFKKGPTFALGMEEQALTYCKKLSTQHLKSLIVKNKYSLTIWIQQQIAAIGSHSPDTTTQPQTKTNADLPKTTMVKHYRGQTYEVEVTDNSAQSAEQQQAAAPKIPTKKVIRQYRGQTYEVEVPDYSAIQNLAANQQKPRRKYRGQYID